MKCPNIKIDIQFITQETFNQIGMAYQGRILEARKRKKIVFIQNIPVFLPLESSTVCRGILASRFSFGTNADHAADEDDWNWSWSSGSAHDVCSVPLYAAIPTELKSKFQRSNESLTD